MADTNNDCIECKNLHSLLIERDKEIKRLKFELEKLKLLLNINETVSVAKESLPLSEGNNTLKEKLNSSNETLLSKVYNNEKSDHVLVTYENNDTKADSDGTLITKEARTSQDCLESQTFKQETSGEYEYDENLKMYYCASTGYYYDTKCKLFYLPLTDSYYHYNYDESQYELCRKESTATDSCESVLDKVNNLCLCDSDKPTAHSNDSKEISPVVIDNNSASETAHPNNDWADYTYDDRYQMYYCKSSGYYYDPNSQLFYNPQTTLYYKYNYSENKYEEMLNSEKFSNQESNSVENNEAELSRNDALEDTKFNNQKEISEVGAFPSEIPNLDVSKVPMIPNGSFKSTENEKNASDVTNDWRKPNGCTASIKELITEIAEENVGMSDYIYDEKSGMHYSKSTGYYYDAKRELLYDPNMKIYYRYIQETSSYEFFYKVEDKSNDTKNGSEKKKEEECSPVDGGTRVSSPESGEIFSSDSEPDLPADESSNAKNSHPDGFHSGDFDPVGHYLFGPRAVEPPCIRAIVEDSSKLERGSLILITCTGALVGREISNDVFFPESSVSKVHAQIVFDNESWTYTVVDLGSQNGTFVNETRLSEPKVQSSPQSLKHGDRVSFGSCKLLIHIHCGRDTCDHCEPGQVMAKISAEEVKNDSSFETKDERDKKRKQELNRLKKKYGLKGVEFSEGRRAARTVASGYEDKAELRRKNVGSENPYEKTESASTDVAMPSSNKGYQMLKKLGWKEGDVLGLNKSGLSEPIPLEPRASRVGLGCTGAERPLPVTLTDRRTRRWIKAHERYFQLK